MEFPFFLDLGFNCSLSLLLAIWSTVQHSALTYQVPMAYMHIGANIQMFEQRMHASCFEVIFLLEDCIGNGELVFSAEFEQDASIVIIASNVMPTKDSFPCY